MSKFWSEQNNIPPKNVYKSSNTKYKFNCNKCNHIFESTPRNISYGGTNCSYCSNRKLCKNDWQNKLKIANKNIYFIEIYISNLFLIV